MHFGFPWYWFKHRTPWFSGRLGPLVLVGTHHKTGTVWMKHIFEAISKTHDLKFYYGRQNKLPRETELFFSDHSWFRFKALPGNYRGLHLIRDPRDVIVSGAFYHQKSSEAWLQEPRRKFQGQSYQRALNQRESLEAKIRFEMEHAGASTIHEMLTWNYANRQFIEVKYEELIQDESLVLFREIFTFLVYPESWMDSLLGIAYENSLFSGSVKQSGHVRSGLPRQWEQYFTPELRQRFLELFGDALVRLGYEADDRWCQ